MQWWDTKESRKKPIIIVKKEYLSIFYFHVLLLGPSRLAGDSIVLFKLWEYFLVADTQARPSDAAQPAKKRKRDFESFPFFCEWVFVYVWSDRESVRTYPSLLSTLHPSFPSSSWTSLWVILPTFLPRNTPSSRTQKLRTFLNWNG